MCNKCSFCCSCFVVREGWVELKRRTALHNLCAKRNLIVIRDVHKRWKRPLMTCAFNWILLLNYTDVHSINLNRPPLIYNDRGVRVLVPRRCAGREVLSAVVVRIVWRRYGLGRSSSSGCSSRCVEGGRVARGRGRLARGRVVVVVGIVHGAGGGELRSAHRTGRAIPAVTVVCAAVDTTARG
jgi:hypothetical protein